MGITGWIGDEDQDAAPAATAAGDPFTDPQAVRAQWEHEKAKVMAERRDNRDAAREEREAQTRRAELADRAEFTAWRAQLTGEPCGGSVQDILRAAAAAGDDGPGRDRAAPYGSPSRPAVLIDGRELLPREDARSVRRSAEWERHEAMRADPFMRQQIAGYRARKAARELAEGRGPWHGFRRDPAEAEAERAARAAGAEQRAGAELDALRREQAMRARTGYAGTITR